MYISMAQLTVLTVLYRDAKTEWRNASFLRCGLHSLNALHKRGLVDRRGEDSQGSIEFPKIYFQWKINQAGIQEVERRLNRK